VEPLYISGSTRIFGVKVDKQIQLILLTVILRVILMSILSPKYTTLRNKNYWFHYKLPTSTYKQSNLTTQLVRLSLNTQNPDKAGSVAQILVFKIQQHFAAFRAIDLTKSSIDEVIFSTLTNLGEALPKSTRQLEPVPKEPMISSAFEDYYNEMTSAGMWREKTEYDVRAAVNIFIELVGDSYMSSLNAATCREYKTKLILYPLNKAKLAKYSRRCINELIASNEGYQTISITTVNNHIRKINSFLNWLVKQGLLSNNPVAGMKLKQKGSPKAARTSFTQDDLKALFSTPIYLEHKFHYDYQFWLPLLALYSGARLEELCQLYISDIVIDAPIPHFNVNDSFDDQHLKNNSSRRTIPIHPELIELGFTNLVAHKRKQGELKLFGYLVPQRQKLSNSPSKWFGKYKRGLDITDPRKVFHSFRHTIVDKLKQIRARDYEIKSLLGHQNGSVTHDIYGAVETPIDLVFEILSTLSFKDSVSAIKPWK
jgi:integrase